MKRTAVIPRAERQGGSSLIETVIALFVLTASALVIVALFHSALQRSTRVQGGATARLIAENALGKVRSSARLAGVGKLDPAVLDKTFTDPDHPDYQVQVRSRMHVLANPCASHQSVLEPDQKQLMNNSVALVDVTVTWDDGREVYRLTSLVEEGSSDLAEIAVKISNKNIGPLAEEVLVAEAKDSQGNVIPDVNFVWWVEPITGNGLLFPDNTTSSARLRNETRGFDGVTFVQSGTCRVAVQARYDGQEIIGYSEDITLDP